MRRRRDHRQRGQAMLEYALLSSGVAAALFLPVLPAPDGGRTSVFFLFIQLFAVYLDSFHTVVSLPVP